VCVHAVVHSFRESDSWTAVCGLWPRKACCGLVGSFSCNCTVDSLLNYSIRLFHIFCVTSLLLTSYVVIIMYSILVVDIFSY